MAEDFTADVVAEDLGRSRELHEEGVVIIDGRPESPSADLTKGQHDAPRSDGQKFSFDGAMIRRHSEAGAIYLNREVAERLLALFESDGPWAAEHAAQLRAAIETYDAQWAKLEEVA